MSISRGTTVTAKAIAGAGATNWNGAHTTDSGTDFLLVFVFWSGVTTTTVSTITWNGVSLAPALTNGTATQAGADRVQAYGLVAPAIQSAATLTVTMSGSTRGGWVAVNYSGVDQTTPVGTVANNISSTNNATPTVTVTSQTGGIVVAGAASNNGDTTTITAGSGQTDLANFIGSAGVGTNSGRFLVSEEAGAASVVMNGTWSTNRAWSTVGVPINAYVPSQPLGKLIYMGSTKKVTRCAWW